MSQCEGAVCYVPARIAAVPWLRWTEGLLDCGRERGSLEGIKRKEASGRDGGRGRY